MENLKKLKSIIKCEFDIDTHNNKSTILFYLPYIPFKKENGLANVDSFYLASNKAYKLAVEYAEKLKILGINCTPNPKSDYKAGAVRCGNSMGMNTLVYRKNLGSRFAIGAIELDMTLPPTTNTDKAAMPCKDCNICQKACPTGAIVDSFDRRKCIRNYMLKPEQADEKTLKAFDCNLLGCDICQKVCPLNAGEALQDVPQHLKEMLNFETLYKNIKDNNLNGFSENFGENYCNKNSLLAMIIVLAANNGDKRYYEIIKENETSGSNRVKFAVNYALKRQ